MKKKRNAFAIVMLALSIIAFVFVSLMTVMAIRNVGEDYTSLKNNDLSQDMSATLFYDDHIYAQIGHGIEIVSGYEGMAKDRDAFLEASIRSIDGRILSCGILYTMMISVILSYALYHRFENDRYKHILSVFVSVIGIYMVYVLIVLLTHLSCKMPFRFYGSPLVLFASLMAVIAGSCILAYLLRIFRFKKLLAVAAIPLIFALFIIGFILEHGLYCEPYIDSFDYLKEIEPQIFEEDYQGTAYYDDKKNVIVVEDKEYEPQQGENADYYRGLSRAGAYLYELLDPFAGNTLHFLENIGEVMLSLLVPALYIIKAVLCIMAVLLLKKNKTKKATVY